MGAHPAEEVQLPRGVERRAVGVDAHRLVGESRQRLIAQVGGDPGRHLRVQSAAVLVEDGARFVEPGHRGPYVMVGRERRVLQLFEHRIVELPPPSRVVRLIRERRRVPTDQSGLMHGGDGSRRVGRATGDRHAREPGDE